ncbi:hypothetical protein AGDE_16016 [Angomonas deanei]|uniref:Trypanosoma Tc-38 (p38) protein domain-containing protein n=1 Tax=Angomonas deanei TaxID=59799 RepID=A0A7G2CLG3_9TRYP|nr:hypothetical protein AGDE_16016 [Angomonas deanei]CAD2220690.1 hypothetical protein, conserved [Angomonas deanei]|eukprot:EPY17883.1 hypothetical protein AGDE_16016 [Angomonas deanei]
MTCQTPEEAAQYARYTTKTDTSQYTHQQQNDIQNNYYNEEGEEDTYIASLLLQEAAEGQDGSERKVQPTRILTPGMQDGVRLLRSLLPPPNMKGHFSISSGKSYKSNMVQGEMELCRLRCHYHSPWWGTLTSFKKKYNAVPLPGEKEHVFFMKKNTKVYHISYFYNAEEILKYLFITPKNGRVHLNARDYFAKEENKLFYSSSELQTVSHFFAAEQAALLSSSSLPTESAWGDGFSTFLAGITEYSRIHQYQIPLFFPFPFFAGWAFR